MDVAVYEEDLPEDVTSRLLAEPMLGVDTETSGLDWRDASLQICQLHAPSIGTVIVRQVDAPPVRLLEVLAAPDPVKIFHFAPFDLKFLYAHWGAYVVNVVCTKAASKLGSPELAPSQHSLAPLLNDNFGIVLDKGDVRTSDWGAEQLTEQQLKYAAADVSHLIPLWERLGETLTRSGRQDMFQDVCKYMPTAARLEVDGYPNPLAY